MKINSSRRLTRDQPLALAQGRYAAIEVEAGTVWLTFPGSDDIFVLAGQRHPLPTTGKAVIEAIFSDAKVTFHEMHHQQAACQR